MAEVRAMVGANVWRVLVSEGDLVSASDTLMILEAMKMEVPVVAEVDGVVTKVAVGEGEPVEEGALLAEIRE